MSNLVQFLHSQRPCSLPHTLPLAALQSASATQRPPISARPLSAAAAALAGAAAAAESERIWRRCDGPAAGTDGWAEFPP